jgi:hypothetical protein
MSWPASAPTQPSRVAVAGESRAFEITSMLSSALPLLVVVVTKPTSCTHRMPSQHCFDATVIGASLNPSLGAARGV